MGQQWSGWNLSFELDGLLIKLGSFLVSSGSFPANLSLFLLLLGLVPTPTDLLWTVGQHCDLNKTKGFFSTTLYFLVTELMAEVKAKICLSIMFLPLPHPLQDKCI